MLEDKDRPVLIIQDLSVEFRAGSAVFPACKNVSLRVGRGETLAVVGESGSGKSVTATTIMGLLDTPPACVTSGSITFGKHELLETSYATLRKLRGDRMAMVFQDPLAHLNPVLSVGKQLAECWIVHGRKPAAARKLAQEMLERVGLPAERFSDYPHQFSGGQRQRIMIAMALAHEPDLIIADEPTTALDATVQLQVLKLIRRLATETDTAVVFITHDLAVAAMMADRVAVMEKGRVVETGPVDKILATPKHSYTKRLIAASTWRPQRSAKALGRPIVEVEDLRVEFGTRRKSWRRNTDKRVRALDGVSFKIRKGETLGILGESGSGKSTLANSILGLQKPAAGSVSWKHGKISANSASQWMEYRRCVQAVFQDPYSSLNPSRTVFEILCEPWEIHRGFLDKTEWRTRAGQLLEMVALSKSDLSKYPGEFSGGQMQRIAIARALALEPELVICDEAVSALDVSIQAKVLQLLVDLRDRYNIGYLFIAHDVALAREFCDRVIVMKSGKIIESGPAKEVLKNPTEPYTEALVDASPTIAEALERKHSIVPNKNSNNAAEL
ncbi:MAG: ABC transporter ATP-binding protein [Roseitalea sp.]|jgi:peptide/nickel transport system ATP-binding protein|nr:ABC transporter ATP-binding protein [Roseitalea sp.]MBO6745303.1 ABC transporter ATP-binding protein [Roseitalea sp.]